MTTNIRVKRVRISAEKVLLSLRESFIWIGYKTKANMIAHRIGFRKGINMEKANATKKRVKARKK